ncbi:hypothetical protein PV11_03348 [Exophiala sideris]|uniref:Uncharacterized protein n=1 Tax=Exophiala sideris TaxID=1016849 RepID=A0A0D1ZLZ8_9EURO|nr:hypothetical protein PV11_03348 [Exophiala sideris]
MASAERPTLLNIHEDVRHEILRRVLAFEPDREVILQTQGFDSMAWRLLERAMNLKPRVVRPQAILEWFGSVCEDHPYSNIFPLKRAPHKPDNKIFHVCQQLHLEARDLFFKVNGFITFRVELGHFELLRQHFPDFQLWNKANPPCQPIIQVIVGLAGQKESRKFVIPAVDLHMLGPALHLIESADGGPWHSGNILLWFASERKLCTILQLKDREALLRRLENDFLFWIGHAVNRYGIAIETADENGKSSLTNLMNEYNQKLKDMSVQQRFGLRVKRMGDELREAYATSGNDGTYLDIKDKILCLARAHKMTGRNHTYPAMKLKLDCMLGFILYGALRRPALDRAAATWRLWCVVRALALPSFFADEGWKLELEAECVLLLSHFPDLLKLRLAYVESVVNKLTPIDTQLRMETATLKNWVTECARIPRYFSDPAMYAASREANREMKAAFHKVHGLLLQRMVARYGHGAQIPQQALVTSEWK